jgi:hypothetical protein
MQVSLQQHNFHPVTESPLDVKTLLVSSQTLLQTGFQSCCHREGIYMCPYSQVADFGMAAKLPGNRTHLSNVMHGEAVIWGSIGGSPSTCRPVVLVLRRILAGLVTSLSPHQRHRHLTLISLYSFH